MQNSDQFHRGEMPADGAFLSENRWITDRPRVLVVACSDGRYQLCLDEFLAYHLGITHYDRLYAPGGPGALASSALSYFRGEQFRMESAFLVEAHLVEEIIFIFHGPALPDGPTAATCADYRRKMHGASAEEINTRQAEDLQEAVRAVKAVKKDVRIRAFRAEVRPDTLVQFAPLPIA